MELMEIEQIVDNTIEEFKGFVIDPYVRQQRIDGLSPYLVHHRHEYIRTLKDVVGLFGRGEGKRVLEIGAFFGVVSICLSKLGFKVCAVDLPEYMAKPEQKKRYAQYNIEIMGVRLENYILPFADEYFDIIIMCEVLEHLNFNPLPLLKEINRIGCNNSLFYLSLPNLACLKNRLRLVFGFPILQQIQIFFDQLNPDHPLIANDHWREYTGAEIREMLGRLGYDIELQYYFSRKDVVKPRTVKDRIVKAVFSLRPTFKENLTTLAIRRRRTELMFHIPKTVHKKLRTL